MSDAFSERHGAGFLRAILDRFRRGAGVPATASDDLSAELAPLFFALDSVEAEAAHIRAAALRRAAAIAEAAQDEIEQILSDGKEQAEAERAEAIKVGRRAVEVEARAIEARASTEAEEIERTGRTRIAPLLAEVLRCVEASPQ
jgi:flagellar biosynthesis/type III secretory pathway protein FliH